MACALHHTDHVPHEVTRNTPEGETGNSHRLA